MSDLLIKRVLAPVELVEREAPDMSDVIAFCRQLGAQLSLFAVIDTPSMVALIGKHKAMQAQGGSTLTSSLVDDAKQILQQIVDDAGSHGVEARGHATVHEDVSQQILREAIVQEVDLILVRPGRRKTFLEKLMGSTVSEVLSAAPCAVMVMQAE